jgi:hypothetical protein
MSSALMRVRRPVPALRLLAAGLLAAALPPSLEAAPNCASPSFGIPPVLIGVSAQPFGLVFGDWNRDGKPDFAVTASGADTVSIRFGDGLGGFSFAGDLPSGGNQPEGIAAGDFDRDGFLDLAVANRLSGTVDFLQGSATGTFTPTGVSLNGLTGATAVAAGDLNGDGLTDLAVAAFDIDRVLVYLQTGAFAFSPPDTRVTGKQPISLVLGDFDRDGDLDIASTSFADGDVSFLQNNGAGVFTEPFALTRTFVGFNPRWIMTADLNKDGVLDLAVAVNGISGTIIHVLKGAGDGTFTSLGTHAAGAGPVSVAVADFDNDGNPDLVASADKTFVYLGDGGGGFSAEVGFAAGSGLAGVAAGDVNGDGRHDIAVAVGGSGQVAILLNNAGFGCPAVSFGPAARTFAAGASPVGAARGDFNKDGRLDVVVTNFGTPGSVSVLLANGPGLFASPASYPVGDDPGRVATGDLDGDTFFDLVVTNSGSNNIAILKGQVGGTFGPPSFIGVGTSPFGVEVADLNRDGRPDIVVSNNGADNVSVLLNTGGGFSGPVSFTVGTNPYSVAVGDVNGDGMADVVVDVFIDPPFPSSSVEVLLGDGLGGFVAGPSVPFPAAAQPFGLVLADFDGDLDLDAATSNQGLATVSILGNDGAGNFAVSNLPAGAGVYDIAAGDVNGDGDPDLVTTDNANANVAVFRGGAGSAFAPAAIYLVTPGPTVPVTGDFTGDGQVDIVTATFGSSAVTLLVGNGSGTFGVAGEFATFGAARSVATADFDRDGILDVVVPHAALGKTFSVHLGDSAGGFGAPITYAGGGLDVPVHVAPGDFDRDGFVDVAVVDTISGGRLIVLKHLGGAVPSFSIIDTDDASGNPNWVSTADFDGDGKLDLAVALDRSALFASDEVRIYRGDGTGQFSLAFPLLDLGAGANPVGIALADVDADGRTDLATANKVAETVSIFVNMSTPGSINFTGALTRSIPGKPTAIAAGDFQGDGRPDLVITTDPEEPPITPPDPLVQYLDNTTAGFAAAATKWVTSSKPNAIAVEDFNLDGLLDVATASLGKAVASILLGKGSGSFEPPVGYGIASSPAQGLVAGDFNRDGRPDLVSANGIIHRSISVLLNTNCLSRRMDVATEPPVCNDKSTPFVQQPRLRSLDDGGNLLRCDGSSVTASLLGGPGLLAGTALQNFVPPSGEASYTDLAVTDDGIGYRLLFTHGSPEVIPARSRRFTVGLTVDIVPPPPPPASLCPGVPHVFSATPAIFDRYQWTLDGTIPLLGSDRVVVPPQSPGSHTLSVDAFFGGCPVNQTIPFVIDTDLSQVTISVLSGSTIVPFAGTGADLQSNEVGGGAITGHQWSFSATPGGPYTDIPGATAGTYTIKGSDFLAPGIYYLVVTATPECGVPDTSPELQVIIFTTAAGPDVLFFTATSKKNENTLEWLNPGGPFVGTLIKYNVSTGGTSDCVPPATLVDGAALPLMPGLPGTKGAFLHAPLANDTAVCYTAFVYQGGGVFSDTSKQVSGRPFDTSGRVKWAYNVGMLPGAAPGNGIGAIHAAFQDNSLHSMLKGASGGTWPAPWFPLPMNGPSQGRPSTIVPPAPISGASRLIFLGSQGGGVYAINADTGGVAGGVAWSNPLPAPAPAPVQAAPSGYFTFFGGTKDHIVVGTRQAGAQNVFYALKLADGTVAWFYDGSADGLQIGVINGQATVDYVNKRVYFASDAFGGPSGQDTVWCLNLETGALVWSVPVGSVMGSPIARNGRLYVASFDGAGGKIHALDAATGSSVWGGATFNIPFADGPVKLFVAADRSSPTGRLLFSTTNKVWALDDPGAAPPAAPVWTQDFTPNSPSAPVFPAGGPDIWVGVSDGKLYRLDYATGLPNLSIPLGDPLAPAQVGSPTLDLAGGFLYVGTEAGNVYCVQY